MRKGAAFAIVLPALHLLAASAMAQDAPVTPDEVKALFPWGEDACYAARFDNSGMKPRQTLSAFYLYRLFEPDPRTEEVEFTREEAVAHDRRPGHENVTEVLARFAGSPHVYTQAVSCSAMDPKASPTLCYVDCDGGSFNLSRTAGGALIAFDRDGGLSMNQGCGETEGNDRWMSAADAGGSFELLKADPAQCLEASRLAVPAYAADPVPLRQRIVDLGWRCLKRNYDQAHLASHPKQQVTAIAVAIRTGPKTEKTEGEYNDTSMEVSLSFRLRSGKTVARDVACRALGFEFACETFRLRRRDASSALLAAGEGQGPVMLGAKLGSDDQMFRLDAGREDACTVE